MVWPLLLVILLCLILNAKMTHAEMTEMTCEADGTCSESDGNLDQKNIDEVPADQQFQVNVINKSNFRADVYWDDGRLGVFIATVEANAGDAIVNTFRDHRFFVTRHGVKEGLFDPETDEQQRYQASKPDETFVIPESAAPSTNVCQDRFSICEEYATNGDCWNSPGWMIVHCCKSCDAELDASRLIDPKIRCSNDFLNLTDPIWEPGDLNRLFTSWAEEKKFSVYDPVVLSSPDGAHGGQSGPWVITFDNFFTSEEADALVRGGDLVGFERSTNQGAVNELGEMEKVVDRTRTSLNAWCTDACEALPEVEAVTDRIEEVTGVPRRNYESFQILEYGPNQFYRQHHDSTGRDSTPPGNRIMTFFLYLSDVEEGGETYFNKLDLAVQPKKGRALVWPSVKDDEPDFWDDRMYHEAKDVIKGKKYAANHWIHLNDYVVPSEWGCTGSFS
jgi:prolyl 4-hydroxylase